MLTAVSKSGKDRPRGSRGFAGLNEHRTEVAWTPLSGSSCFNRTLLGEQRDEQVPPWFGRPCRSFLNTGLSVLRSTRSSRFLSPRKRFAYRTGSIPHRRLARQEELLVVVIPVIAPCHDIADLGDYCGGIDGGAPSAAIRVSARGLWRAGPAAATGQAHRTLGHARPTLGPGLFVTIWLLFLIKSLAG